MHTQMDWGFLCCLCYFSYYNRLLMSRFWTICHSRDRWLQRTMALASARNLSFPQKQMVFVVWLWCHTTQLPIDMQKVPSKMWSKGWRRPHKVLWLHVCIAKVLFNYRLTPQGTTGISPFELLLGWRPRKIKRDLRNTEEHVEGRQLQQKTHHDMKADGHNF